MDQLLAKCDYITVHVPLNDSTRGLINSESIAKMKKGVKILNFARGELVDNKALLAAIESGQVDRYVTDFPDKDVIGVENIIPIPHPRSINT